MSTVEGGTQPVRYQKRRGISTIENPRRSYPLPLESMSPAYAGGMSTKDK